MRKWISAGVALLVGVILGGTVFRAPVADAAAILQVRVTNSTSNPVPVDQQGTADVNVTNSSLDVAVESTPPAPVTSDGQSLKVTSGVLTPVDEVTASALVIHFHNSASEITFFNDEKVVASFPAPGPLVLPLSQPLTFDAVGCDGSPVRSTACARSAWPAAPADGPVPGR